MFCLTLGLAGLWYERNAASAQGGLSLSLQQPGVCGEFLLWHKHLRIFSFYADAETRAWKKQTHKGRNMPTLGHTHTHAQALPSTCLLASLLWLITELVCVCFCLVTQCIYTDFVILPASQYWRSAELRGNTQTGVRKKKKPTWYMLIWRFGGSVRANLQKIFQVSLYFSFNYDCCYILCWWFLFLTFYSCIWSTGESDTLCIIEELSPLLW